MAGQTLLCTHLHRISCRQIECGMPVVPKTPKKSQEFPKCFQGRYQPRAPSATPSTSSAWARKWCAGSPRSPAISRDLLEILHYNFLYSLRSPTVSNGHSRTGTRHSFHSPLATCPQRLPARSRAVLTCNFVYHRRTQAGRSWGCCSKPSRSACHRCANAQLSDA